MIFPGMHMPQGTAAEKKARSRAWDKWVAEEAERVRRQRAPLTFITGLKGRHGASDRLIKLMLDRAWDLLEASQCEAADALLEFVPEDRAEALLREFFPENYE